MSAADHLNPAQFYHGTRADLTPGDMLDPGHPVNSGRGRSKHVYYTGSQAMAAWAADLAKGSGPGRIYTVEPTGAHEDDPMLVSESGTNPTRSYRTRSPVRVTGEL